MRVWWILAVLMALAGSGCLRQRAKSPPPVYENVRTGTNAASNLAVAVTQELLLVGKVVSVNPTARFVVINYPLGSMPPIGRRLSAFRQGVKMGEVRITGPQRDDNIVGDITAGSATVGDEVRER